MLGNNVALWEVILAAIKLGVVIIPASTLLSPDDLADRIDRGEVRHVMTEDGAPARNSTGVAGGWTRIAVRREPVVQPAAGPTLAPLQREASRRPSSRPDGPTRASDPLLLYFTSGTTAQPKLVEHTQVVLPGRPPVHDVLDRAAAGRHPPEHLLAGLGEARLEQRVRAVERGGDASDPQLRAVSRRPAARGVRRAAGDHVLRAAHGVADADPVGPRRRGREHAARMRRRGRAAQPRGDRAGAARPGGSPSATGTARPRPPRRSATRRASRSSWARWAGRCPVTGSRWSTR